MSFKVAVIGAGSIGFTREMIKDLLSVPEFRSIELAFTDINQDNLDRSVQLIQRDIDENGVPIKIHATKDRREAFRDAKYVFNFVRIGMLEAFYHDVEIPMKYGIDQCVGDTLGPGGIMYGQRGIPEILNFCQDIKEVAKPGCIMLNYANPNSMITWACNQYGDVPTIGLCHGVQGGHQLIANALEIPKDELDIVCVGINHQTWYTQLLHKGKDVSGQLLEALENHPVYSQQEKVRIDMLKRFGYFSTESNGHLSEYLPWYRKRPEEIKDWISMDSWITGESAGYLRHCMERRNWYEIDFPEWLAAPPLEYPSENQGVEHGSHIVEALETGRVYRGHFNVVNNGVIKNLADDAVVEVPGYVDANGVSIPVYGDLPLGCAAVCTSSIDVQRLAVEAAVQGDEMLLKQSMMMDSLTGAVLNPPEIWQMTDEMLVALEPWLPQYRQTIAAAKERLETGPLLPIANFEGASRREMKTPDEIRQDPAAKERYKRTAHKN